MKKTISVLVVLAMLFSLAMPVFADEANSAQLEKAIKEAKAIVDVPDSFSDFDYYSWAEESGTVWTFTWTEPSSDSSITVTMDASYNLTSFYKYIDSQDRTGLGKISSEEGQKAAEAFLNKAMPDKYQGYALKNQNASYGYLYLNYDMTVNGLPLAFVNTSITVDLYSGEVESYYCYDKSSDLTAELQKKLTYPEISNAMSKDKAVEKYLENIGVKLCYMTKTDYQAKTRTSFPAYVIEDSSVYIDAVNGEKVTAQTNFDNGGGYAGSSMATEYKTAESEGDSLTPSEQAEVDTAAGFISQDEAVKIIAKYCSDMSKNGKVLSKSINKDPYEKDRYIMYLSFENGDASVNAKTGELLSYYVYDDNSSEKGISKEKAKNIADNFIKNAASEKSSEMVYTERNDYSTDSYTFWYKRQVNGIEYSDNGICITVNKADGKITSYDLTWYNDVTFASVDKVISEKAALDEFVKDGFNAQYIITVDNNIAMVYGFSGSFAYNIDPFTGAKINSRGEAYRDTSAVSAYSDIKGKWYESTVKKLLDNGYYLPSTDRKFNGNSKITQENFLRYLFSTIEAYYNTEDFYEFMINRGVLKEGEKNSAANVTRAEAAKYMIRYMNLEKAGEQSAIYKNVFKDKVPAGYEGYAALAKALGIMKGDTNGRFNGSSLLTNAEAAVIVYNTLNLQEN